MKRLLAITLSSLFLTATQTNIHAHEGYIVEFPPIPNFDASQYLDLMEADIQHTQKHSLCIKYSPITESPATALIVGAGTIGIQAVVIATRLLPEGSTIVVIQNDIDDPQKLVEVFKERVERGEQYRWIVSERIEIGQLDKLEAFIAGQSEILKHTHLYIHTADRAERFVPDALPYQAVIAQVVRRASVVHINDLLEKFVDVDKGIVKILVSSECSQNRSEYKIPNLGPYQVGKIVGDEMFLQGIHRKNSISVILYSGPMDTQGQVKARTQEYELLSLRGEMKSVSAAEEYIESHRGVVDIDPMDSVGAMLNTFCTQYRKGQLSAGCKYRCYGASVNPELGHPVNELEPIENTRFMWPTLEEDLGTGKVDSLLWQATF